MASIKWVADLTHSEVKFKVKHLMLTTVSGYFRSFDVEALTPDAAFTGVESLVFTAEVDSISTNNAQRDTHLKSADFFDAAQHSQVRFVATEYEQVSGEKYKLLGELSIRGITRPVALDVAYGGTVVDPYGQTKAGFSVHGKLSRKEFGLTWNAVTEAGSVVVSNEIKLHAEVQLVKQVPYPAWN
ncbi:YceI family protein [Pontibacter kalidii]|uniref:YceI family protein n=1 Tax=Pontibacter kalidii TaxID=2592049 RepID=UPI002252A79A|nr:YceI family protein [Pontibacter kalidii]